MAFAQLPVLQQTSPLMVPPPSVQAADVLQSDVQERKSQQAGTGAFAELPVVAPADEHIVSAMKRARKVPPNNRLKNEAQRARNL